MYAFMKFVAKYITDILTLGLIIHNEINLTIYVDIGLLTYQYSDDYSR